MSGHLWSENFGRRRPATLRSSGTWSGLQAQRNSSVWRVPAHPASHLERASHVVRLGGVHSHRVGRDRKRTRGIRVSGAMWIAGLASCATRPALVLVLPAGRRQLCVALVRLARQLGLRHPLAEDPRLRALLLARRRCPLARLARCISSCVWRVPCCSKIQDSHSLRNAPCLSVPTTRNLQTLRDT